MTQLPPYLDKAIQNKRLLVFAGAGISILPPSSLPDWRKFNESILGEIKRLSLTSELISGSAASAVRGLSLDEIGFKLFSEAIVKIIAGDSYFPVLQVLDSPYTNANHHAIAELAGQGIIQTIATTNFDTLLERGFSEAGVPLKDLRLAELNDAALHNGCTLYKIHGSVNDTSTLVDTVGQKVRGLHPSIRVRLAELFQQYHVLVIGYSGEDLNFDADYLSFSSLSNSSMGITWLVRPGSKPSSLVKKVIKKAGDGGQIFEADLPEFFRLLGATEIKQREIPGEVKKNIPVVDDLQDQIGKLLNFGHLQSTAFCMRMLLMKEKFNEGKAVREVVVAEIQRNKDHLTGDADPDFRAGPVLRALAVTSAITGGDKEIEYWTLKELEHYGKIEKFLISQSTKMEDEYSRLKAGAFVNLALVYAATGKIKQAGDALKEALGFCELCADGVALASMFFAYGVWSTYALDNPDLPFNYLLLAEAAGMASGNLDAAMSASLYRVHLLIQFAEYDSAYKIIRRTKKRLRLNPGVEIEVEFDRLSGLIECRRGRFQSAYALFRKALKAAKSHQVYGARVQCSMIAELYFLPEFCTTLMKYFEKLVKAMDEGNIPGNGEISGILSRSELEPFRSKLSGEKQKENLPYFLIASPEAAEDEELRLHYQLAVAEFRQEEMQVLKTLRNLAIKMFNEGRIERALEMAEAYLVAAIRNNEHDHQLTAIWIEGKVYSAMGDVGKSIKKFKALLHLMKGPDNRQKVPVYTELAFAQWASGDIKSARTNAGIALKYFPSEGDNEKTSSLQELIDKIDHGEKSPLPSVKASARMISIVEEQPEEPMGSKEIEMAARAAFYQMELGAARVLLFNVMDTYRLENNNEALAGCYELLADAAKIENRFDQADKLLSKALSLKQNV